MISRLLPSAAPLLCVSLLLSSLEAANVYQDQFTGASIPAAWNTIANAPVTLDDPNDQIDYNHTAGTSRRFLNYNGLLIGQTGYLKAEISNFAGSPAVWFGFVGTNAANNSHYAQAIITGDGTYEMFMNNTASAVLFDNGAGWSGTLAAGAGLWSTDGGATSAALTLGANFPAAGANMRGFGFANFGNSSVFPSSSFSIDSILVDDSLTISPPGNTAPTINISTPTNGATFTPGASVTFTGTASDPEDGDLSASLSWSSSIDSSVGSGPTFNTSALTLGAHTITASATDSGSLTGTSTVTLNIATPGNMPPAVAISAPADNSTISSGSTITFTASSSDDNDGDLSPSLAWYSNINGFLGNGASISASTLSLGRHTITATSSDSGTLTTQASITLTINAAFNASAPRPNVIVIICDDAGYADFSFMDGLSGETSQVPTPHLEALAARGVTFSKAFVAANCQPTRAAMMTGAYQQRIGNESVGNNHFLRSQIFEGIPTSTETMWDRMKAIGYKTGAIGKWHIGQIENEPPTATIPEMLGNRPENQGIDEFYGMWHGSRNFTVGTYNRNGVSDPNHLLQPRYIREALIHPDGSKTDTVVEYTKFVDIPTAPKYITNIFGDYAEQFVTDHHDDPEPFFLYVAHPAPHKPWTNESPDYNDTRISGLTPNNRRQVASMMITMDREIGELMAKLDDPNGDGDTSDSITDETLVIFINDNGGVSGMENGINGTNNGKLKGFKGSSFDGGIRVPMILAGAGLDPAKHGTVYHRPVHGVDILPTALKLAGGSIDPSEPIDGVDILPFVNGSSSGDPHDVLVHKWRGSFAVIKGDYKLQNSRNVNAEPQFYGLYRSTNGSTDLDPGEDNNLIGDAANAALVQELKRDLTDHEAFFDKPRYAILANSLETEPINIFDHHVFRPGLHNDWSGNADIAVDPVTGARNWHEGGTTTERFLFNTDSFAGAILEFPAHPADYTANNDYRRKTGMEYMLNRIILSGNDASSKTANLTGLPLIFTNNLAGEAANIDLTATGDFTFDLDLDLILYHDLTITGDGTATLQIDGDVSQHFESRGIQKTGSSNAEINGTRTYSGDTQVLGGALKIAQINTADEAATYRLATGSTLDLTFIGTDTIDQFFIDGTQQAAGVYGATGSGAQHETTLITGPGTLTVTSGPVGYTTWADQNAPGAPFTGDHDSDLVPNGIEYFMGETGSTFTMLPSIDSSGNITWPMSSTYSGIYGTDFYLETSPDLSIWDPVLIADVTITPGASLSHILPLTDPACFIRLALNAE
ncbi:sulfatase-like hydrolase/transferase [Akkermansiaceae bacterium]|nr:sulfatase-like hydrolase/transferase [Akkermansiaceae bacterium]